MRIILFFDLPTETYLQQKEYRLFHKFLVKDGFIMMQESVYCKLALNSSIVNSEMKRLVEHKPKEGIIQVLTITEKQFSQIEYLVGNKNYTTEDSDKRLIVI